MCSCGVRRGLSAPSARCTLQMCLLQEDMLQAGVICYQHPRGHGLCVGAYDGRDVRHGPFPPITVGSRPRPSK